MWGPHVFIFFTILLFFIMNSARAHMNSTSSLLFCMNSTHGPHMNSTPGPTWTVPPAPCGAATHGSAPNLGALVYVLNACALLHENILDNIPVTLSGLGTIQANEGPSPFWAKKGKRPGLTTFHSRPHLTMSIQAGTSHILGHSGTKRRC